MKGKVSYRQQFTRCGKQRCRKCPEGKGHGPYWYAYWSEKGHTVSKYIGVRLPPDVEMARQVPTAGDKEATHQELVPESSPVLRIYLLGQFRIERKSGSQWQAVDAHILQRRRARALLGCLLSNSGRRLGREQVIELLWPDLDIEVAMNRLNGAVHELRQILEPGIARPADSTMLRLEGGILALADSTQIWVDAEAFELLLKQANVIMDPEQTEHLLEKAASLYRGSYLLEELYSGWAAHRRDSLQRSWVGLFLKLAHVRAERGAVGSAIEALDRLRTTEPTNETALQGLMILLTQLDRRGEALQLYRQYVSLLQRDYENEPLPETRELYEALCKGHIPAVRRQERAISQQEVPVPLSSSTQEIPFVRPAFQTMGHHSPLVGRHCELDTMRQVMLSIADMSKEALHTPKPPHFLLLTGESGIGKTRLAEELSLEAYTRGWAVAWSKTYEQEGTIPYHPWTALLHTLLQDTPSHFYEQERPHVWAATRKLLATLSETCPLLLVLDDLHWADDSSIALLTYLTHHLHDQRILLVGTCRDEELGPTHKLRTLVGDLQREQAIIALPVQPLTQSHIGMLVAHLPEDVVQRIQTQAAGNPFFAQELARDCGAEHSLPETVAALLERRLSKVSSECRVLLGKAAVLGDSFELSQLVLMAREYTEDAVLNLLEEALHTGLLTEEGTGAHISYHFWHPLIVSYLYEHLAAARRAYLHRRAADVIREIHDSDQQEKTILYHLIRGGSDPKR